MSKDIKLKQERINRQELTKRVSFSNKIQENVFNHIINYVRNIDDNYNQLQIELEQFKALDKIVLDVVDLANYDINMMTKRLLEVAEIVPIDVAREIRTNVTDLDKDFIDGLISHTINGKNYSDRVWDNKIKLASDLEVIVKQYVVNKDINLKALSKDIAKRFDVDLYKATRLVNNEVARVENAVKLESYRQSEVIQQVEYMTMEDELVTELCQSLRGNIYDINDPNMPRIPEDTHIGCRSYYRPVIRNMRKYKFN